MTGMCHYRLRLLAWAIMATDFGNVIHWFADLPAPAQALLAATFT